MTEEKLRQCWYCEFYLSLGPTWGRCTNKEIIIDNKPVTVFGFNLPKTENCFQDNSIPAKNSSERS